MRFNPTLHRATRGIDRLETPQFEQFVQQTIIDALKNLLSTRGLYQKEVCDLTALTTMKIVLPDPVPKAPSTKPPDVPKLGFLTPRPVQKDPTRMPLSAAVHEASIRLWMPDITEQLHSQLAAGLSITKGNLQEIYEQPISFRPLNFTSECPNVGHRCSACATIS